MNKTLSGLYDVTADHVTGITFSGNYINNFEDYLLNYNNTSISYGTSISNLSNILGFQTGITNAFFNNL